MIDYEVLIPAYNAEEKLSKLISQLKSCKYSPQKILIINDGSMDETPEICKSLGVKVVSNKENMGKGYSLRRGFDIFLADSSIKYLLCMDADLQHPVTSIPEFLQMAENNSSEFIIGARKKKLKLMPFHRILSNSITSVIISLIIRQKIKDSQCGFRLFHRNVIRKMNLIEDGFQMESEMILQAGRKGIKIESVDIPTIYNSAGSHIGNFSDTFKFIKLVIRMIFNLNNL